MGVFEKFEVFSHFVSFFFFFEISRERGVVERGKQGENDGVLRLSLFLVPLSNTLKTLPHRPVKQRVLDLVGRQRVPPLLEGPRGALDPRGLEVGHPACDGEPGVEDVGDALDEGLGLVGDEPWPVDHVAEGGEIPGFGGFFGGFWRFFWWWIFWFGEFFFFFRVERGKKVAVSRA